MGKLFGEYIRTVREDLRKGDPKYSIRQVAKRIGLHHSYLSKVERGESAPLSEKRILALAQELGVEPELLMVMNGKVSEDVRRAVFADPEFVISLLHRIKQGRPVESKGES